MNANTRLIDVTIGDFLEFLKSQGALEPAVIEKPKNYVHRLSGIARLFGVSKRTVTTWRADGWIEPAIKQIGKNIICDADMAIELFAKRSNQ
jgi:hypothetical protein